MAFTQTNVRLIAGYSSIAQLGFITIGIFSLRPDGADGSVLQMVNHGLVVAGVFLIVALLAERAGSEDLNRLGRARDAGPVLAAIFLIVTLATLAMPGSANFVGEFYILIGVFQAKIVFAFVAAIGVILAAYYAIRLFQRTMHNRKPEGITSREIGLRDALVVAPLAACIVGLALYPGLILGRSDAAVKDKIATCVEGRPQPVGTECSVGTAGQRLNPRRRRSRQSAPAAAAGGPSTPPHIDYAGISPVIALTAGICAVLVGGVLSGRHQRLVVSALSLTTLAAAAGLCIWQWGAREDLVAGALRLDELGLAGALIAIFAAAFVIPLSWREPAAERPGEEPRPRRLPGAAPQLRARAWCSWRRRRT